MKERFKCSIQKAMTTKAIYINENAYCIYIQLQKFCKLTTQTNKTRVTWGKNDKITIPLGCESRP